MKVYFTGSIAAKDKYLDHYKIIIKHLEDHGHSVISEHILGATETQIRITSREDRLKFHDQLERWIKGSDFMIAETSFPSISVGYEISLALKLGKPVLILYSEGDPPSLLAHHQNETLACEHYTRDNIGEILTNFIHYVEGKSDMRFTFFITADIASYLDEVAKKEKLPKSVYLRKLIEKDMRSKH